MIRINDKCSHFFSFYCSKTRDFVSPVCCSICSKVDCICKNRKIMEKYYRNNLCENCKNDIAYLYFVLVEQLKKADLLAENHRNLCCDCFSKKNDD